MAVRTKHHRLLAKLEEKLKGRPNIVGFGHAIRIKGGKPTRQRCLAVFVKRKIDWRDLAPTERIRKSVTIDGKRHRLDVVQVGIRLRRQVAFGDLLSCDAYAQQREKGTRSGYFRVQKELRVFSCAHVIWGDSKRCPNPPVSISSSKPIGGNDFEVAPFGVSTADGRLDNGQQLTLDWGYIDCASARVNADVVPQVTLGPKLKCFAGRTFDDFQALTGLRITGHGLITPVCTGTIQSVMSPFKMDPAEYVDFTVVPDKPNGTLTLGGDSGLLWKLDDGTVIGVHCLGNDPEPPGPSTLTVGVFIQRVLNAVNATELLG